MRRPALPSRLPGLLATLSLVGGCHGEWTGRFGRGGPASADAPNVLLVSVDTLRADHLPFHGYPRDTAPFLARIAAEGAIFDQSWSQSPATDGSHASLFTGTYQSEHGKFSHLQTLGDRETTLAEHLRAHGWRTFAVASSAKFIPESGFTQGFEDYSVVGGMPKIARSRVVTDQALAEIGAGGDAPWFGFVHYFDAHAPYHAPDEYAGLWLEGRPPVPARQTAQYVRRYRTDPDGVSPADLAALEALYDGQIRYFDHHLEDLWAGVTAATGRSTLVVITADHGEAFHEHAYLGHGHYLYEEIVRVPLVVWWPGRVVGGAHLSSPVQNADVFPTIADLAGVPATTTSGHSFAATLRGATADDTHELVLQSTRFWSIVKRTSAGLFKFTVKLSDKAEKIEQIGGEGASEADLQSARDALYAALAAHDFTDPRKRSLERNDISDEEVEQLRELGYVGDEDE